MYSILDRVDDREHISQVMIISNLSQSNDTAKVYSLKHNSLSLYGPQFEKVTEKKERRKKFKFNYISKICLCIMTFGLWPTKKSPLYCISQWTVNSHMINQKHITKKTEHYNYRMG